MDERDARSSRASLENPDTLRQLVRDLQEGIYIADEQGVILDANPACLRIFGVDSLAELGSQRAPALATDPGERVEEMRRLARGGVRELELHLSRPNGAPVTVRDTCYAALDPASGRNVFHGVLVDITRRKVLELQLQEQSLRDPLTGCHNRRFLSELERRVESSDERIGVVVIDIDNFKLYNDRHGHQQGDAVLVQVATFLARYLRAGDPIIRMGGDEFLVVLAAEQAEATADVARRLREAAATAVVPCTVGWAMREPGEPVEKTIARADRGLIEVRSRERNGSR